MRELRRGSYGAFAIVVTSGLALLAGGLGGPGARPVTGNVIVTGASQPASRSNYATIVYRSS